MTAKIFSISGKFFAFYVKYEYAVMTLFVLIWQTAMLCASNGHLLETDSYTHILRLMDFIQSGSWKEILYRHDNCPFGQILHFTRLTDMFLFMTTLPFLAFMELKKAVLFGGFLYNPVIACLTAVALIWTGRSFFGPTLRAIVFLLYFTRPWIASLFQAGRPDHHVLLNLLLIVLAGCLMHGAKTQKTAYYKTAGIFGGLAVWATPEGFLSGLFIYAGMVTAWLFRLQNMRQIRLFSQYFFISTAVCLLVNPPMQGLFYPDNGRLSVLMVVILGFAFLSFYAEEFTEKKYCFRSFGIRFLSLSLLALISSGWVFLLFGEETLFASPFSEELQNRWSPYIMELQVAYPPLRFIFFLIVLGLIAFFLASARMRKLLITFWIPLFLFFLLMALYQRFNRPATVFAVAVFPLSLHIISLKLKAPFKVAFAIKFLCVLTLFACYGYFPIFSYRMQRDDPYQYMNFNFASMPFWQKTGCLFTAGNEGPQMAWETGMSVIGTPYHSNAQGIIDNDILFNSLDPDEIPPLLKKRQVSTIFLVRPEFQMYYLDPLYRNKKRELFIDGRTFGGKLAGGKDEFCFLKKIPDQPENIKKRFLIYHVDFSNCPDQKEQ